MIVYNVTISVDKAVHDDWLKWMVEQHIPDVLNTGLFLENKFYKVLSDEDTGITYSIQYFCNSMKDYETYVKNFAPALQKQHTEKFRDRFVAFRTLLEKVV